MCMEHTRSRSWWDEHCSHAYYVALCYTVALGCNSWPPWKKRRSVPLPFSDHGFEKMSKEKKGKEIKNNKFEEEKEELSRFWSVDERRAGLSPLWWVGMRDGRRRLGVSNVVTVLERSLVSWDVYSLVFYCIVVSRVSTMTFRVVARLWLAWPAAATILNSTLILAVLSCFSSHSCRSCWNY